MIDYSQNVGQCSIVENRKSHILVLAFRWIGVAILPVVSYLVVALVASWLLKITLGRIIDDDPMQLESVWLVLSAAFGSYVLPIVAYIIAPFAKKLTCVILVSVFSTFFLLTLILNLLRGLLDASFYVAIFNIVFAILGAVTVYKNTAMEIEQ